MQSVVSETFFARVTQIVKKPRLALIHPFKRKTPFALKIHNDELYSRYVKSLEERRVIEVRRNGLDVAATPSNHHGPFNVRCCHVCWSDNSTCKTCNSYGHVFMSTSTGCIRCAGTGIRLDETLSPCQCATVLGPADIAEKETFEAYYSQVQ